LKIKKKKSVGINAVLNIIKQCCAIIFPLITFPYASRVLGVENYGKVNFGTSIISYFTLLAGLGITNYAIREGARIRDDKENFSAFVNEVFTINVVTTLISYAALFLTLIFWDKLGSYRVLILIQSLSILFTTIGTDWINSIYEEYAYITIRYVIVHIIAIALMFIFVRDSSDYIIYAFIAIFGTVGANAINIFHIRKIVKLRLVKVKNLKLHLIPMIMLFCNSLSVLIYVNSDVTMLGILSDDKSVGIYSAATKIYNIIKQLINAIIVVMIPRLSALLGKKMYDEYNKLLRNSFHAIVTLLAPAITGVFVLSYEIIWIIGGEQYAPGYVVLSILSIALGGSVFANFFNNAILVPNKKEKYFLIATITAAIANIVLNFILIPTLDYVGTAVTTVIAEYIVLGFGIFFSRGLFTFKVIWRDLISSLSGCIFIVLISFVLHEFIDSILLRTVAICLSSVIGYFLILIIFKNSLVTNVIVQVKKKLNEFCKRFK
jgi:O-antigen/teichoic acid export membrane protein